MRNWLRSPKKSVEWLWNETRFMVGAKQEIEMRPGWLLRSHPSAYRFAYFAQHKDPEQIAEFDSFISSCGDRMKFFDIGAHFGLFSLAALHYGGASALAVAVDPSPTAARIMKIQSRLNLTGDRLTVVQSAMGERAGWRRMVATGANGACYFVSPGDHRGRELTRTRVTTLDQLSKELGISPTHVKIDVEGDEAAVLKGGREVLTGPDSPLLFLELHNEIIRGLNKDPAETLSLLETFGYEIFSTEGSRLREDFILSKPLLRVVCKNPHVFHSRIIPVH
ncbi:MAG TPA: FkbM family methyltransferase [Pyrinomonadaceae bacterium]|nr:FkbM family methyltransferase [Pyrinomonadaceae bacterium]